MDWWNDMIDKGKNPTMKGIGSMFSDALGSNQNLQQQDNEDNELFMGGIPVTMPESKVKQLCESFGLLKKFMVHKDPNNPTLNKGFCFFEYVDSRSTEKAIKHLNNMEFGDKRLKVQRKSEG